jgi:adenylate cyclase
MNQSFHDELIAIISDVQKMGFEYISTNEVPSAHKSDSNLTYESGVAKKGKVINTCVLYVDIRDSVKLVEKHQFNTMGKLYTIFTKSILKIADHYNAKVRNIIGDRIMVVFNSENCFTNAVNCAISINHLSQEVNKAFNNVDFKCGIGVDYGEMRVIKVGTEKKGDENANYKNLIWVGYPANRASRLTDIANKKIEETYFIVQQIGLKRNPLSDKFESAIVNREYTNDELVEFLSHADKNTVWLDKNFEGFQKKNRTKIYQPILISKTVFDEYKKANPEANDIKNNWWQIQPKEIKNITEEIYGVELTWKF